MDAGLHAAGTFPVYTIRIFANRQNLHLLVKFLQVCTPNICQSATPCTRWHGSLSRPQVVVPGSQGTDGQGTRAATRGSEILQVKVRQEQVHN